MNPSPTPRSGQDAGVILGVVSLLAAILSLTIGPFGIVAAVVAIATGIMARGRAKLTGNTVANVLGTIGITVGAMFLAIGVVVVGLFGVEGYFYLLEFFAFLLTGR